MQNNETDNHRETSSGINSSSNVQVFGLNQQLSNKSMTHCKSCHIRLLKTTNDQY